MQKLNKISKKIQINLIYHFLLIELYLFLFTQVKVIEELHVDFEY